MTKCLRYLILQIWLPESAEADLFDHIRSMVYTTGPAMVISLIIYFIIGFSYSTSSIDRSQIDLILNGLKSNYAINPLTLFPAIVVNILAVRNFPDYLL